MMTGHPSLTVLDAQTAVCDRLKEIFAGVTFNSSDGSRKAVGIYPQDLPVPKGSDDDSDSDPSVTAIPYIIVRLTEGKNQRDDRTVSIILVFGAYDLADDRSGYRDIVIMIERITESFMSKPHINNNFEVHPDFEWAINQEDTSPFNFGAMQLTLSVPSYNQEPDSALV